MAEVPKQENKSDTQPPPIGLGEIQNLGEAANKAGLSKEIVAVLEADAGIIIALIPGGLVPGIATIILGLLSLADTSKDNVQQLVADFQILFDELQAEADVATMRSVSDKVDIARTALRTFRTSPDDPNLKNPNGIVLFNTSNVVLDLGGISFYLRPFFPAAAYFDFWSGRIDPPPFPHATSSTIVFDYRLTLPAFLEAIGIRLILLAALVPNFRTVAQGELRDNMATPLENLYARIRDGIVAIRKPTVQEILSTKVFNSNDGTSLIRIDPSVWDRFGRPYGAVERYSAISVIDQYKSGRGIPDPNEAFLVTSESPFGERDNPNPPPLPKPQFPSQEALAPFLVEYAIGTLARSKAVYNVIGLRKLKEVVNLLKDLAGEPRLQPGPDGDWSVREIDSTVAPILFNRPSTADGPNAPIKLSRILRLLQPFGPVSLRKVLDSMSHQN